jgi:1-aminocyclopropane-1-carboxylate deaminase
MFTESQFKVENSVLQELNIPHLKARGIQLFVKRDDLIHPLVSGNKWRKLKYNILQAQALKSKGILTFGGAYSNHLVATSAACKELGFTCIGLVRGDELTKDSNESLRTCHDLGMKLVFIDRLEYNLRNDWEYHKSLQEEYPSHFIVNEGGANYYGMIGCQEIWNEIDFQSDHLFVSQGTTTTSCGLLLSKPPKTSLHVVPVLKGFEVKQEMKKLLKQALFDDAIENELLEDVIVHEDFHFDGYGKYDEALVNFISEIMNTYQLPLDHVYTAKTFYALLKIIEDKSFDNTKIVFLHTGGLQGSNFWKV